MKRNEIEEFKQAHLKEDMKKLVTKHSVLIENTFECGWVAGLERGCNLKDLEKEELKQKVSFMENAIQKLTKDKTKLLEDVDYLEGGVLMLKKKLKETT